MPFTTHETGIELQIVSLKRIGRQIFVCKLRAVSKKKSNKLVEDSYLLFCYFGPSISKTSLDLSTSMAQKFPSICSILICSKKDCRKITRWKKQKETRMKFNTKTLRIAWCFWKRYSIFFFRTGWHNAGKGLKNCFWYHFSMIGNEAKVMFLKCVKPCRIGHYRVRPK